MTPKQKKAWKAYDEARVTAWKAYREAMHEGGVGEGGPDKPDAPTVDEGP